MAGERRGEPEDGGSQRAVDSWTGLLGRLEVPPAGRVNPVEGAESKRDEPGRKRDGARMRPSTFLRLRIGVAVGLSVFGAGLAWIAVPALIGRDPSPRSESAPAVGRVRAPRVREASPVPRRPLSRPHPRPQRVRGRRLVPSAETGRHRSLHTARQHRPPEPVAIEPEAPSVPSEPPPSSPPTSVPTPESNEPAQPSPGKPKGEAGLVDGSTSSAEFGL